MLWRGGAILEIEEDVPVIAMGDEEEIVIPSRYLEEHVPWGIKAIQADLLSPGPHDVTVCVVDSGIAAGHPDFQLEHFDGSDRDEDGLKWDDDRGGHGSHITGIISAASNNNVGVRGVGNFNMFIARALDNKNGGSESFMWRAVEKCIEAGADVINLSLGALSMTSKAAEVYSRAADDLGIIMVAAAGNTGDNKTYYPAHHPSVIAVGATDATGERIKSSVNTAQLELQGPGYSVLSTGIASCALHIISGSSSTFSYPAKLVEGTPQETVSGELVYCTLDRTCEAQGGKICLFDLADEANKDMSYEETLDHCDNGGGAGAVFFDSRQSSGIQSLQVDTSAIPAISIRPDSAMDLLERLENSDEAMEVTMGDSENDELEFTYTWGTGSSIAAAHVAAGAALLKSHFYSCTSDQIRYALAHTAKRFTNEVRCDEYYGYGVIQVRDAFDWLLEQGGCDSWTVGTISKGGCTTLGDGIIDFKRWFRATARSWGVA
jgi:serine protease